MNHPQQSSQLFTDCWDMMWRKKWSDKAGECNFRKPWNDFLNISHSRCELPHVGGSWVKRAELDHQLEHMYCCSDHDLYVYNLEGHQLFKFERFWIVYQLPHWSNCHHLIWLCTGLSFMLHWSKISTLSALW